MPSIRLTRILILLTVAGLLAACATAPRNDFSHDGLELRQVRGLDEVWVRPGTDFASYRSIVIEPVSVAFDPSWDPRRTGSRLRLSEADRESIRADAAELFDNQFARELQRSGRFELVEQPREDSLIFKPQILDLFINAPEDRRAIGHSRVYVSEFGRVTLVGELRDAETGAIVARINDREIARATRQMEFADRFTNEREGERVFSRWARALLDQLEQLSGN